jgi:hypothetical protein
VGARRAQQGVGSALVVYFFCHGFTSLPNCPYCQAGVVGHAKDPELPATKSRSSVAVAYQPDGAAENNGKQVFYYELHIVILLTFSAIWR